MSSITTETIARKIETQLEATVPAIADESHQHAGHVGAREGSHFRVVVVSPKFARLSMVKQHRLVYEVLADEMQSGIHALALQTFTPEQWSKRSE
ncbi:MAG: BolA family protein [Cyanobacteria bacterium P01_E01_bin.45]